FLIKEVILPLILKSLSESNENKTFFRKFGYKMLLSDKLFKIKGKITLFVKFYLRKCDKFCQKSVSFLKMIIIN
ncbi:hypothetical protein MZO39_00520, partial [Mycoplasma capricolum subsp. capricolum]|uniref:hypothetical protein n=1 Tax=Mycoplasma capricolum TaxID=2095 RepID=UPI0020BDDB3F